MQDLSQSSIKIHTCSDLPLTAHLVLLSSVTFQCNYVKKHVTKKHTERTLTQCKVWKYCSNTCKKRQPHLEEMQDDLQVAFKGSKPFFPREATFSNPRALLRIKLPSSGFILMIPHEWLMYFSLTYTLGKCNCNWLKYFFKLNYFSISLTLE